MQEAQRVVVAELAKRREAAVKASQRDPAHPIADDDLSAADLNKRATDMLKAVFGKSFFALPAMGKLPIAHRDELQLSLLARGTLLGTDETKLQDSAPNRFLTQVAVVRDGMRRWRSLSIYGRAVGRKVDHLEVMQLPNVPGEAWAGRAVPPSPGRVSLLAFTPDEFSPLDPALNLRGVVLDDWVESIPRKTEPTAVAFHFDHPNAEAPQAILVAVPAAAGATWTFDDLLAAVNETFELTDVRSLNPETLSISPLIPKASLAFVPGGDEPSTSFENNKAGDRGIKHF
jgi:hypothetical protein